MNDWLVRLYAWLLCLYPRAFRDEFADEMRAVFAETLADAARAGDRARLGAAWRELRDLPRALLRAHWRARRNANMNTRPRVGWVELVVTLTPFLLILLVLLMNVLHIYLNSLFGVGLVGVLVVLALVGLARGLPRWALPTLGFLAAILNLFAMPLWIPIIEGLPMPVEGVVRGVVSSGPWFGLIAYVLVAIFIIAFVRPLAPLYARLRADWTGFAFALYGVMAFALILTFDDYVGEEPYEIAALFIVMLGAWTYLRAASSTRRMLILGAGVSLAMGMVVFTKWLIIPQQPWDWLSSAAIIASTQQNEMLSTVYTWGWMIVLLFLPALLRWLPSPNQPQTI
ncbi:MAG: hypothetical protein HY868_22765 [Chloroflexi bacterium]|nr:hypothetical protein [Chloroflexota bacterium]